METSSPKSRGWISPRTQISYWPWRRIFGIALAIWMFVVLASSLKKAPVVDEVPHIGAGLTYWKFYDFRMNPEHPVLIKLLSVLPVMLLDKVPVQFETEDYRVNSWFLSRQDHFGYYLLFRNQVDPRKVVFHARLVPVFIGALGAAFAFWYGRRFGGSWLGGALAALLLMLYPEYAGHSRFVTLDVPTLTGCAGISMAALFWWRYPGRKSALIFALTAAVGSGIKLPVTVFAAAAVLTMLLLALLNWRKYLQSWIMLAAATVCLGYWVAWAGAGFRFELVNPAYEITERSVYAPVGGNYGPSALGRFLNFCWRHRLLPEATLATLIHTSSFNVRNYYFLGRWQTHGWYSYFFATFLLKTSIIMIMTYLAAVVTWTWQVTVMQPKRRQMELSRLFILLMPFVLLFGVFVLGRASLGHRYILFIYFPLSALTGVAMARWWIRHRYGKLYVAMVLLYNVVVFAKQFPHYETYFNEAVRTPYKGMKYVADSNIDWGQDFALLGKAMRESGIRSVNLAAFGSASPAAYGVTSYRWILHNYPFAVFQSEKAVMPDPSLLTATTLNGLLALRSLYPGKYLEEPVWIDNSIAIFAPENNQQFLKSATTSQ